MRRKQVSLSLSLFLSNGCTHSKLFFFSAISSVQKLTGREEETEEEKEEEAESETEWKKDSSGANTTRKELPLLFHFETYYLFSFSLTHPKNFPSSSFSTCNYFSTCSSSSSHAQQSPFQSNKPLFSRQQRPGEEQVLKGKSSKTSHVRTNE